VLANFFALRAARAVCPMRRLATVSKENFILVVLVVDQIDSRCVETSS
jgi:hypothetical protein